ncbi:exocyst complex component 2 [Strongylocentrotus purpuratus]|uniref:Exocyst complex component 2 n=1 Tax=Strongylocentrotus purpuratus TaxID=7668 RepID=A0A7M7N8B2_STRPU|nr:exocyst complex component 2 [Strongylocentrotus purpuratus]
MQSRKFRDPPKVTGLSPKEGPPGTKLTIRGENLGFNEKDVFCIIVCGVNITLLAEWISPSKIICRTTNCKGPGDVIVSTKSGGIGTSTVKFRGLQILPNPLQDSAIWVDESSLFDRRLNSISRPSSPLQSGREDPLGLPMEHAPQLSDEEAHQMFPKGSSNLAHRNFEPALFLIESHSNTSFVDLRKGLEHLKRQSSGLKTEGPQTFIKSNLGTFMNCQDILATIHGDLCRHENIGDRVKATPGEESNEVDGGDEGKEADEMELKGEGDGSQDKMATLQKIEDLLLKGNENAQKIFQSVLHRKDRADSTRNALNVLNRFKFLFHLPITIERNIKKGDYEVVINDYERARQLFSKTQVTTFKKVYDEVENKIRELQVQLHEKLMELPTPLDEQKRLIRYLVELGGPGDPAWECIVNEHKWIQDILAGCKDQHIQIDQKGCEVIEPPSHASKVRGHRRNFSGSGIQVKFTSDSNMDGKFSPPQQVLFLEELADNLLTTFPNLWRLGQSYFNASVVSEAGGKSMIVDSTKEASFTAMMTKITTYFADLVRAAFLPESLEKKNEKDRAKLGEWGASKNEVGAGAWLPQCVRSIRSVLSTLVNLEVPTPLLEVLQSLLADLRVHCMVTLFKEATEDIKALHGRETWVLQMDEHGGITTTPTLFESIVVDILQHLKEVIICTSSTEKKIFDNRHVERQTVDLASDLLMAFASCLEQLAFVGDDGDTQKLRLSEAAMRTPESLFQSPEDSIPSMEQCLVIVLSNCSHVSQHVVPNLIEQFKRLGYPSTHEIENISQEAYAELDEKIFEAYCEQKIDPLVGALEVGVYAGNYDWGDCPEPTGASPYVKEALMNAVAIHAEINAIAPAFMLRVMGRVLEAVADEMSRIMSCVTGAFCSSGAVQARLDIGMLEVAMSPYRNAGTSASFKEALSVVPQLKTELHKKLLQELQSSFHRDLQFLLTCFTTDS